MIITDNALFWFGAFITTLTLVAVHLAVAKQSKGDDQDRLASDEPHRRTLPG